jgi:hypothetical protein
MSTYILIVDDDPLAIFDVNAIRRTNPPLPEDAVNPGKGNLFPI